MIHKNTWVGVFKKSFYFEPEPYSEFKAQRVRRAGVRAIKLQFGTMGITGGGNRQDSLLKEQPAGCPLREQGQQ